MSSISSSYAKNRITASLKAILDPPPSKAAIKQLWQHFDSQCAYCGLRLSQEERHGHLDHAKPYSHGGTNSIYNHVLACAICNGDEKREMAWDTFLSAKVAEPTLHQLRFERITKWLEKAAELPAAVTAQERLVEEQIIARVLDAFDKAATDLRAMR